MLLKLNSLGKKLKQHFMVISNLRPFTNDVKVVKSLSCEDKTRGEEVYAIRKFGITWQLPGLYFSLLVVWYLLIWIKDGSYIIPALTGTACYLFLWCNPAGSYALFNTLLNAKFMRQYIKHASQLERRIVDSLSLKIVIFLAYALFLYTAWFYYFPPYHPLYVCFLVVRLVIFPYLLLTWLFKAAESVRAATPEAFLLGEAADYAKGTMKMSKGGMSVIGAVIGATTLVGGLAYHSQKETVDIYQKSIGSSQEILYSRISDVTGCKDIEITKRAAELANKSREFSDTTGRLLSDPSPARLLPRNAEALRIQMEKGLELRDKAAELVVDRLEVEVKGLTLTSQPMSKELGSTAPPVSPGSPLENISCEESTSLIQEITTLAKISLPF